MLLYRNYSLQTISFDRSTNGCTVIWKCRSYVFKLKLSRPSQSPCHRLQFFFSWPEGRVTHSHTPSHSERERERGKGKGRERERLVCVTVMCSDKTSEVWRLSIFCPASLLAASQTRHEACNSPAECISLCCQPARTHGMLFENTNII